jgi:4-methylaminobutanoate oxidase (formaldehyde-forming)
VRAVAGPAGGIAAISPDSANRPAVLAAGSFEIDIAGTRVPAQVSLKPVFDPERSRVLS